MCYPDPHSLAGPNGGIPFRQPLGMSGRRVGGLGGRLGLRVGVEGLGCHDVMLALGSKVP